jgi:arginyl-tRNA synthetase
MWSDLRQDLALEVGRAIQELFGVSHTPALEVPPRRELGDLASPAPMQLARLLKRNPRAIAEELATVLRARLTGATAGTGGGGGNAGGGGAGPVARLVREMSVLGGGYLNFFLDRPALAAALLAAGAAAGPASRPAPRPGKVIVEHTNINPNKAAHIGHLRNAVLGDVLARCLRSLGHTVEVQNYIDDTGVQLADVVVGFLDLRRLGAAEVAALPEPFDYLCWDLYSEVRRWYDADGAESAAQRRQLVRDTLHQLETGSGERAEMGRLVARRIVTRHLATMRRLGVSYDLLTHESDILALHFFDLTFARLKECGAVHLVTEGKNRGCWVMPLAQSEEFAGLEDPDKVIVRSDGTVTYVGKDIAYQLWKFGLLGRDFGYRLWVDEGVWETCPESAAAHPAFGGAERVINVIDTRQSYLQKIVRAGLEALGHPGQAARSVHFAYEMVALSAETARQLGYRGEAEEGGEKALEMSGRKGIGVKADDLIDQLEAKSREELLRRAAEAEAAPGGPGLDDLAHQIAVAALRFYMVKATTNRVIAFDFDEALNFEGESGPYLQYALVRAQNIRRRLAAAGMADEVTAGGVAAVPAAHFDGDLWELILEAAQSAELVEKAIDGLELSLVARQALQLAQRFNTFYRVHPILRESDAERRAARLAAVQIFAGALRPLTGLLGIPIPERM